MSTDIQVKALRVALSLSSNHEMLNALPYRLRCLKYHPPFHQKMFKKVNSVMPEGMIHCCYNKTSVRQKVNDLLCCARVKRGHNFLNASKEARDLVECEQNNQQRLDEEGNLLCTGEDKITFDNWIANHDNWIGNRQICYL